jgi:monoamine oxidase
LICLIITTVFVADILDSDLAGKLSRNLSAALTAAASNTSADTSSNLASSLLATSSPLFSTLDSSSKQHLAKSLARTLEIGMGVQLEDVSLSCFGYEDSAKGTDAAISGGYSALIKRLAEEVERMGGEIRLASKAENISAGNAVDSPVSLDITSENGTQSYSSRLVLSTVPLSLLQKSRAQLFKSLSPRKSHAIDNVHVGKLGKLVISYGEAWWPTDIGVFTILPSETPSDQKSVNTASSGKDQLRDLLRSVPLVVSSFAIKSAPEEVQPPPATHATLLVYIPVPIVAEIEGCSATEVGQAMHDYLVSSLPGDGAQSPGPRQSVLTDWAHDPYSLGATSTPLTVKSVSAGITPTSFIELGRPESLGAEDGKPRVLFAGEHTSINNRGSVTGAVESGLREGRRAVQLLNL